jgi:hypothetical protein
MAVVFEIFFRRRGETIRQRRGLRVRTSLHPFCGSLRPPDSELDQQNKQNPLASIEIIQDDPSRE